MERVVSKSISVHAGSHSHFLSFEVNCDRMLSTQVESVPIKDSIQFVLQIYLYLLEELKLQGFSCFLSVSVSR